MNDCLSQSEIQYFLPPMILRILRKAKSLSGVIAAKKHCGGDPAGDPGERISQTI
jgi:hypothetical protein